MASAPPSRRFSVCLDALFAAEGGFNNLRADRGGATNFGISLRFLRAELRVGDPRVAQLLGRRTATAETVRSLTKEQAAQIYRWCFWDPILCDELAPPVDHMVFDQAVNAGPGSAVKLLQRAINLRSVRPVAVDGRLGPKTLAAANALAPLLVEPFRKVTRDRYDQIVKVQPSQRVFLAGWMNRADKLGTV